MSGGQKPGFGTAGGGISYCVPEPVVNEAAGIAAGGFVLGGGGLLQSYSRRDGGSAAETVGAAPRPPAAGFPGRYISGDRRIGID